MPLPRTPTTVVLLCDCGTKSHSVFISKLGFDEPHMLYEIVQIPEQQTLWARIKQAFNLILGREIVMSDTVITQEQADDLCAFFQEANNVKGST